MAKLSGLPKCYDTPRQLSSSLPRGQGSTHVCSLRQQGIPNNPHKSMDDVERRDEGVALEVTRRVWLVHILSICCEGHEQVHEKKTSSPVSDEWHTREEMLTR